jgi:transposase
LLRKSTVRPSCFVSTSLMLIYVCIVCKLLFLPPYSPTFNPIELAFSSVKAWLRRHWWDHSLTRIHESLIRITPEMALQWFNKSGYHF